MPILTSLCNVQLADMVSVAMVSFAGTDETKMTLLLLDEAQLLYGINSTFWSGIKALNEGYEPRHGIRTLRVILACSFVCSPSEVAGESCAKCELLRTLDP